MHVEKEREIESVYMFGWLLICGWMRGNYLKLVKIEFVSQDLTKEEKWVMITLPSTKGSHTMSLWIESKQSLNNRATKDRDDEMSR